MTSAIIFEVFFLVVPFLAQHRMQMDIWSWLCVGGFCVCNIIALTIWEGHKEKVKKLENENTQMKKDINSLHTEIKKMREELK